jgi:UDP-2-acetamido-3-amino-2,3-dideoxy-glucuronate N-acetyltransferase
MKNIACLGAGYWGSNLIRNFYELESLALICDSDTTRKEYYKNLYPDIPFTTNYDSVLKDESIKGVVIATPSISHYNLAKEALTNKKDVFIEKPICLNLIDAKKLIEQANNLNKILMVGHILQYHPAITKLKELIDSNYLGKIYYVYSNRLNIGKIRTEENVTLSFAPHDISVIQMLLNDTPESVFSTGGNYLQENIADTTMTIMKFKNGVQAHIFVSWLNPFKEQKLVIIGSDKMIVFDDTIENKLVSYNHKIAWENQIPTIAKAKGEVIDIKKLEPLKEECRHFIECIQARRRPKTDGKEGLQVLHTLLLCENSLRTGHIS